MADSTFSVSGLASGIDTQSIVDKLVSLEGQSLSRLQKQQSAYKSQVSVLGDLSSKLAALKTAASDLATNGVLGLKTTSTNSAFTVTPGSNAVAGSYDIAVETLATPTKRRLDPLAEGQTFKAGTLTFTFGATSYDAVISDGASFQDIAYAIKTSGAPVSAVVFDDDGGGHLSLTTTSSGASSAPTISFAAAVGAAGTTDPVFATTGTGTQTGVDAAFTVNGFAFTRSSNTVTDGLPGATLQLKAGGGASETLTLANDTDATQAKLKTFVDAYNGVMQLVQKQLSVTKSTNRSTTLAGDSTVRNLQSRVQGLVASKVFEAGSVRTLADLGVKTQNDGTLTIDSTALAAAIGRDPGRVNALFADATAGVSKLASSLATDFTSTGTGLLAVRQSGLESQIKAMDAQVARMQTRLDDYRKTLLAQFNAMEQVVSGYKSVGNYLAQMSSLSSK